MFTLRIPDMTCGHCASTIARAVASVDKAARLEVSMPDQLVSISSGAAESELMEAIQEAGYTPEPACRPAGRAATSAGCCCGSRRTAPVDAGQTVAPGASPCCG